MRPRDLEEALAAIESGQINGWAWRLTPSGPDKPALEVEIHRADGHSLIDQWNNAITAAWAIAWLFGEVR
jgi:hypothetical protein